MQAKRAQIPLLRRPMVQTLIASLICILLGLLVGYIALLIINPAGASEAIISVLKNFWAYSKPEKQLKNFGITLVTTAPLLMCAVSVLFAYKVSLFNIGAAGQYVAGAGACLYCALALHLPWVVCMIAAMLAGALLGGGELCRGQGSREVVAVVHQGVGGGEEELLGGDVQRDVIEGVLGGAHGATHGEIVERRHIDDRRALLVDAAVLAQARLGLARS